jgi:hypothetical protein
MHGVSTGSRFVPPGRGGSEAVLNLGDICAPLGGSLGSKPAYEASSLPPSHAVFCRFYLYYSVCSTRPSQTWRRSTSLIIYSILYPAFSNNSRHYAVLYIKCRRRAQDRKTRHQVFTRSTLADDNVIVER